MGRIPTPEFSDNPSYRLHREAPFLKAEILEKLKTAEEETARGVERAKERAADLLKAARREAEEILRRADAEGLQDEEAQLGAERARLQKERARILDEGAKREGALRQAYAKNVDATVRKGLEAFLGSLQ